MAGPNGAWSGTICHLLVEDVVLAEAVPPDLRWSATRECIAGVTLPLRLAHSVLADLVAARRPTVTSALSDLAKQGFVRPNQGGWLIAGEPPRELQELRSVARGV